MKYIFILLFLFLTHSVYSTGIIDYNFTKKDGLPSNTIYSIYRAKNGYLWISTDRGISRYNGLEFKNFTVKDGLSDNEIFFFFEDNENRLWLGTYNGSLCYLKDNIIYNEHNDPSLKKVVKSSVASKIIPCEDGSLIFLYIRSKKLFLYKNHQLRAYEIKASWSPEFVIEYATYDGKNNFHVKTREFECNVDTLGNVRDVVSTSLELILRGQNSFVDLTTDTTRHLINIGHSKIKISYDLCRWNEIICVHKIKSRYFIGTTFGLFIVDSLGHQLVHTHIDQVISSITEDITGSIWISTLSNGIYQIPKDYDRIKFAGNITNKKAPEIFIQKEFIHLVDEQNEIINIDTNLRNISKSPNNIPTHPFYKCTPFTFNGSFYIYHNGVFFNNQTKPIIPISSKQIGQKKAFSTEDAIYIHRGMIISKYDKSFRLVEEFPEQLTRIFDLNIDSNKLYYSTIDSLFVRYNHTTQPIKGSRIEAFKHFFVYRNFVIGINHKDELTLLDFKNDKVLFFQKEVYSLHQIEKNRYLFSSDKNIFIIEFQIQSSKNSPIIFIHSIRNDLIPLNFESIAFNKQTCYVFYDKNLISFPTSLLESKVIRNQIKIENIKTKNTIYNNTSSISVSESDATTIRINLKILFFAMSNPDLAYSVVNTDSKDTLWSSFKSDQIDLYNISSGNYSFIIKNELNEIIELVDFNITQPLYKRWQFLVACFLALFTLSYFVFYQIIKTNKKVNTLERKALVAEYKSLNAILNPHFIFNSLSSLQTLIRNNKNQIAEKYLLMFASLIRLNMKNIIKEKVTLEHELEIAEKYLAIEKLRFKDQFEYKIKLDDDIECSEIYLPPLSIQPIIENSIKHGFFRVLEKQGIILIIVSQRNQKIYISVEDNGIGLDREKVASINSQRINSLEIIKKRFNFFKELYEIDIKFSISNILKENEIIGTCVELIITPE